MKDLEFHRRTGWLCIGACSSTSGFWPPDSIRLVRFGNEIERRTLVRTFWVERSNCTVSFLPTSVQSGGQPRMASLYLRNRPSACESTFSSSCLFFQISNLLTHRRLPPLSACLPTARNSAIPRGHFGYWRPWRQGEHEKKGPNRTRFTLSTPPVRSPRIRINGYLGQRIPRDPPTIQPLPLFRTAFAPRGGP